MNLSPLSSPILPKPSKPVPPQFQGVEFEEPWQKKLQRAEETLLNTIELMAANLDQIKVTTSGGPEERDGSLRFQLELAKPQPLYLQVGLAVKDRNWFGKGKPIVEMFAFWSHKEPGQKYSNEWLHNSAVYTLAKKPFTSTNQLKRFRVGPQVHTRELFKHFFAGFKAGDLLSNAQRPRAERAEIDQQLAKLFVQLLARENQQDTLQAMLKNSRAFRWTWEK